MHRPNFSIFFPYLSEPQAKITPEKKHIKEFYLEQSGHIKQYFSLFHPELKNPTLRKFSPNFLFNP